MACLALTMGLASIVILHGLAAATRDLGVANAAKMFDAGMINGYSAEFPSLIKGIIVRTSTGANHQLAGTHKGVCDELQGKASDRVPQ